MQRHFSNRGEALAPAGQTAHGGGSCFCSVRHHRLRAAIPPGLISRKPAREATDDTAFLLRYSAGRHEKIYLLMLFGKLHQDFV